MSDNGVHGGGFTPTASAEPSPHPLAIELAEWLRARATPGVVPRVLLLGVGSGRNVAPFVACGATIGAIEADPERAMEAATRFAGDARVRVVRARYAGPYPFAGTHDAALSTHALLHGTRLAIAAAVLAAGNRLASGAPFFATLGSQSDPRYGVGRRVAETTFAPFDGPERGVEHTYFDEAGARALFAGYVIESLEEVRGGESVGRWAHVDDDAERIVHWFVRARRA